jgi:hypothetical protein
VGVRQPLSEGVMGRMRHVGVMRLGVPFFALVALAVFALPLAPEAQPAGRIPRLCFLTFDPGTPQSSRFDPFFQGLRDLGYVDGQTITIDYLSADGRGERFPALAADCLRLKADIIVVTTTPATQAAKNATRTVPIDAGGLMAYASYTSSLQARTATYVDKILKGAKPADLPVEQPTKFELIINRKTAKVLSLTIPPSLLRRADQIID